MEVSDIAPLVELARGRRIVALTGAGCSTESGIPDYRSDKTRAAARKPIWGPDFVKDPEVRRRYWARAFVGWRSFASAAPNPAHVALAAMEERGLLAGIVTQNVDRLHHVAGSKRVIELHGALAEVTCIACQARFDRASVQRTLEDRNPEWIAMRRAALSDGDALVEETAWHGFVPPGCDACGEGLRPHVVFFGEQVKKPVVESAFALCDEAELLLVAGTSLTVFSGYRFVKRARERGVPYVMVNLGETRGDDGAAAIVRGKLGEVLPALARALAPEDQMPTSSSVIGWSVNPSS